MNYDVLVIGAGQAGPNLAVRLAKTGKRVLLVEAGELGGTCVNTGCTPTKTMMASARAAHVARSAARLGVHAAPVRVDLAAIVERKDAMVAQWRQGVRKRLESVGDRLQWIQGWARFTGAHEIRVGDRTLTAETIILDVGAHAAKPALDGIDSVPALDNASIMQLREIPRHLVVLGGGYIAVEFAQMFRRFGAAVTIVERGPHLLGREDDDVSGSLEEAFRAEDIDLRLAARAAAVRPHGHGIRLQLQDGTYIDGSHFLVAVGRQPATRDLGCEAAGIELDARGAIVADAQYRTTVPGVYAVGDVLGGAQFTHNAWDDHRLLFDILMGRPRDRHDRRVPYSLFTDPQLARVGLSETEARAKGIAYEVATMPFGDIARATELDERAGILKVLVDPASERILGAAIVGAEAGELIHIFVTLMQAGAPARAIVDAQAIHPTLAEGVQSVVMRLPRYAL